MQLPTSQELETLLNACYLELRNADEKDLPKVREDLSLLDLNCSEDDLSVALYVAKQCSGLKDAIKLAQTQLDVSTVTEWLEAEKKNQKDKPEKKTNAKKSARSAPEKAKPSKAKAKDLQEAGTMRKVIDYNVVEAQNHYDLISQVRNAIKQGWQPLGGVGTHFATALSDQGKRLYQALAKYE